MGKPFSAGIRLNNELKIEFDFGQARLEEEAANPPDFSSQESLGPCPKCGARVFEYGTVYVCEKAVGADRACDFRSGKMILQQPVEPAQMQKLLATGRTDLLTGFISRKNRKFKAYLAKGEGRVIFEFEPRKTPAKNKVEEPAAAPYGARKGARAPAPAASPAPTPAGKRAPKTAAKTAAKTAPRAAKMEAKPARAKRKKS
jgi:DNA topoisomerase-3